MCFARDMRLWCAICHTPKNLTDFSGNPNVALYTATAALRIKKKIHHSLLEPKATFASFSEHSERAKEDCLRRAKRCGEVDFQNPPFFSFHSKNQAPFTKGARRWSNREAPYAPIPAYGGNQAPFLSSLCSERVQFFVAIAPTRIRKALFGTK